MQQVVHTIQEPVHAKLIMPGSKSITYRAILLAALAEGVSEISGLRINEGIKLLITALHNLGVVMQLDETSHSCIIAGCNGKFPKKQATIWCDDNLLVARFLLAACSATSGVFYFDGNKRLREKFISQLITILTRQGAQIIPSESITMPFTLIGGDTLEGGEITLDQSIQNQLISALLMAAPFARAPFTFTTTSPFHHAHVDMTCAMMAEFGVLVHRIHQGQFMVPVPQRYHAKDYYVEPDFSLASYFFAATAISGGEIMIQSFKRGQSKQANANFLTILESMGCHVRETHSGLILKATNELHGIEVSMRDFSDTFLALTAIAPFAKSPTRISHINSMRKKELERMKIIKNELIKMGIHVETGDDWIKIFPGKPRGGLMNAHHDSHLAMSFFVLGLKTPGVIVDNIDNLLAEYPEFLSLWNSLIEPEKVSA